MNKNTYFFQISQGLFSLNFGIGLIIPYILFRGFSLDQALYLMSFYALVNILAEFPTGLIGDYYSHKVSIVIGIFLTIISIILFIFQFPLLGYFAILGIMGIGTSLVQGSDIALLKSISPHFKKDYSYMGSISDFLIFIASITGGFLVSLDIRLPWVIQIIPYFIAIIFILLIKKPVKVEQTIRAGNIYVQSKLSINYVIKYKIVLVLLIIAGILGGYAISVKTIVGSFSDVFRLSPQYISWLVAFVFLSRSMGKMSAIYMERLGYKVLFSLFLLTLILLAFAQSILIVGIALLLGNFVLGVILILLNSELVEEIEDGIEASVISLRNLLVRTCSSLYLFLFGVIIVRSNFSTVIMLTIVIFMILGITYIRISRRQNIHENL